MSVRRGAEARLRMHARNMAYLWDDGPAWTAKHSRLLRALKREMAEAACAEVDEFRGASWREQRAAIIGRISAALCKRARAK